MLLYRTSLMELYYEASTDIMRVMWPDIEEASPLIIEENVRIISESIRTYYIKRFLLDARQTSHIPDPGLLKEIYSRLLKAMSEAGLQKIARVSSLNPSREMVVPKVIDEALDELPDRHEQRFQLSNFDDEQTAIEWLLNK